MNDADKYIFAGFVIGVIFMMLLMTAIPKTPTVESLCVEFHCPYYCQNNPYHSRECSACLERSCTIPDDAVINTQAISLYGKNKTSFVHYNERVVETPLENPYNPLIQPGRYTNYQNNHPNATVMPKEIAEQELQFGVWITDINGIPVNKISQYGKFTIFEVNQNPKIGFSTVEVIDEHTGDIIAFYTVCSS
jgi:hypothetical protein